MSNKLSSDSRIMLPWTLPRLHPPKVVAIAKDNYLTPQYPFPDKQFLPPTVPPPKYGQDITFGYNRKAPGNRSVGSTEAELKPKMRKLLEVFAKGDGSGMATRLFDRFLAKQNQVTYFDDNALNAAASKHQNIRDFCDRALNAPRPFFRPTGNIRIHQALKNANWNIKRIIVPTDLGVPAFNRGFDIMKLQINKFFSLGDFNNGLGVMMNGVQ